MKFTKNGSWYKAEEGNVRITVSKNYRCGDWDVSLNGLTIGCSNRISDVKEFFESKTLEQIKVWYADFILNKVNYTNFTNFEKDIARYR